MSKYVRQEKSQRKHPIISSSNPITKAPVVPTAPIQRPGWKGPAFVKKTPKQPPRPPPSSTKSIAPNVQLNHLPIELQQLLLNIFRGTFPICQDYDALKPTLQQVKNALDDSDFERAFGSLDWMRAYAVRWSPSQALCCSAVLLEIYEDFKEEVWIQSLLGGERSLMDKFPGFPENPGFPTPPLTVVCFGKGPAEAMAFGSFFRQILSIAAPTTELDFVAKSVSSPSGSEIPASSPRFQLHIVNEAKWAPVIDSLKIGLTTPPTLSKYASATARAKNAPFLTPEILNISFRQSAILTITQDKLRSIVGREATLITFLFTLNDLLTASAARCTAFLLRLTLAAPQNSLLLIIDSVDSLSDITVEKDDQGKETKIYPMGYFLGMVLSENGLSGVADGNPVWEKVIGDQSRLFRLAEQLKYPLGLENIRFQLHLFRKL